jgi:hypothetical protein
MVVMSILSDAQELMACNTTQTQNQARQQINIAKYILSEMLEKKGVTKDSDYLDSDAHLGQVE